MSTKTVTKSLLLLFPLLTLTLIVRAEHLLYIAPTGNDANDCLAPDLAHACANLSRAFELVQYNTTIIMAPGDYIAEDNLQLPDTYLRILAPPRQTTTSYQCRLNAPNLLFSTLSPSCYLLLEGFTISTCQTVASAILGGTIYLKSMNILGNNGVDGMGPVCVAAGSKLFVESSTFTLNTAFSNDSQTMGGAISVSNLGIGYIRSTKFYNNRADIGGAIFAGNLAELYLEGDNIFISNSASAYGGGLVVETGSTGHITGGIKMNFNVAGNMGGGIYAPGSISWDDNGFNVADNYAQVRSTDNIACTYVDSTSCKPCGSCSLGRGTCTNGCQCFGNYGGVDCSGCAGHLTGETCDTCETGWQGTNCTNPIPTPGPKPHQPLSTGAIIGIIAGVVVPVVAGVCIVVVMRRRRLRLRDDGVMYGVIE